MIDRDLAELYLLETKVLKQAVRRNMRHFPEDFMLEMNTGEFENWRSKNVASKADAHELRHPHFVLKLNQQYNNSQR